MDRKSLPARPDAVRQHIPANPELLVRIEPAEFTSDTEERAILGQVRVLQDCYRRGDQDAANALLQHLFDDYGHQRVVDAMRWEHAGEQLAAEIELFTLFGA